MTFRPLPIMTVLSVASLAVLLILGHWQWGKYTSKIGRTPEVAANAPVVVSTGFKLVSGEFTRPQRVYGIADGEAIWRRYVVAERIDTGEPVLLAVDATGGPNPIDLPLSAVDVEASRDVRIFERLGEVSARNRPEDGLWYTFHLEGILRAIGLNGTLLPVAEPVTLSITSADDPARQRETVNPYGAPRPIDPLPPERHFGYALTWWGLAGALIGVYVAFHMAQGRLRLRSSQ